MKLGFIGYGNMASAIAKGLVSFNVIKTQTSMPVLAIMKNLNQLC